VAALYDKLKIRPCYHTCNVKVSYFFTGDLVSSSMDPPRPTGVNVPDFNKGNPHVWFFRLESQFRVCHVERESVTTYDFLISKIPDEVLALLDPKLLGEPPSEKPYTTLKKAILSIDRERLEVAGDEEDDEDEDGVEDEEAEGHDRELEKLERDHKFVYVGSLPAESSVRQFLGLDGLLAYKLAALIKGPHPHFVLSYHSDEKPPHFLIGVTGTAKSSRNRHLQRIVDFLGITEEEHGHVALDRLPDNGLAIKLICRSGSRFLFAYGEVWEGLASENLHRGIPVNLPDCQVMILGGTGRELRPNQERQRNMITHVDLLLQTKGQPPYDHHAVLKSLTDLEWRLLFVHSSESVLKARIKALNMNSARECRNSFLEEMMRLHGLEKKFEARGHSACGEELRVWFDQFFEENDIQPAYLLMLVTIIADKVLPKCNACVFYGVPNSLKSCLLRLLLEGTPCTPVDRNTKNVFAMESCINARYLLAEEPSFRQNQANDWKARLEGSPQMINQKGREAVLMERKAIFISTNTVIGEGLKAQDKSALQARCLTINFRRRIASASSSETKDCFRLPPVNITAPMLCHYLAHKIGCDFTLKDLIASHGHLLGASLHHELKNFIK
jgi:hypothetical protein